MGRASRPKPVRLAEKLKEIRQKLSLSQNGMIRRIGMAEELTQAEISAFERGIRVPPLTVLLEYARAISMEGTGEYLEILIDDNLDLPEKLPSTLKKAELLRRSGHSRNTRPVG
jgi:transcriptional regulator with XRE-family HTH domain